jgi:hypothetical protein
MGILSFDKPEKERPTAVHNLLCSSDCGVPGTYVPNMSEADNQRWKAKHIKGKRPRVEIRKQLNGVQLVIKINKNEIERNFKSPTYEEGLKNGFGNIKISANGALDMTYEQYCDFVVAITEALHILNADQ